MTVSAAAAILQTDRAEVRTDIPAVQLENLPVPVGRNYQNLFVTVPGISPPENMHSVAVNPARGLAFSSNGTTRNANSIRIGRHLEQPLASARGRLRAGARGDRIGRRHHQHVRRGSGPVGGMSANVLIKSGTNLFRGSAFEHFYDEALKSRPTSCRPPRRNRGQPAPVRRHARRSDRPQQGVLLRELPGHLRPPGGQPLRDGADRRDAQRGLLGSPTPIYDPPPAPPTAAAARRFPATSFRASGSIRSCRSSSPVCRCRTFPASPTTTSLPATTRSIGTTSTPR